MEDKNLIQQAREMHKAGKSLRIIAALLGTSKSNVHRWVNNDGNIKVSIEKIELTEDVPNGTGQAGTAVPNLKRNKSLNLNNMENYKFDDEKIARDIYMKKMDQEHNLAIRKQDREDKEINLRNEQLRMEKMKLKQPLQLQKQEEKNLHWDMLKFFKDELELIEDSDNEIEITFDQLTEKIELLKQLIERLEKHCFKYDIEVDDLAFHSNLKQLLKYFKNKYQENIPELVDEDDEDYDEDEENDEDVEENEEEIIIEYMYEDSAIKRIEMLTKAEFDQDKEM